MRWICTLVIRQRFDALYPSGNVGKPVRKWKETKIERLGGFFGRCAQDKLDQRKDADIGSNKRYRLKEHEEPSPWSLSSCRPAPMGEARCINS
jgi:hypothetical protein